MSGAHETLPAGEQMRQQAEAVERRSARAADDAASLIIAQEIIALPLTLRQIARRLAKINRFAGNTHQFYSVAQHSVLVSECLGADPRAALYGLLHDAHEAKLSDIPQPFAALMTALAGFDVVASIKMQIDGPLYAALGLAPPDADTAVKIAEADARVFATEVRDVVEDSDRPFRTDGVPMARTIGRCWPWAEAEEKFCVRYAELRDFAGDV